MDEFDKCFAIFVFSFLFGGIVMEFLVNSWYPSSIFSEQKQTTTTYTLEDGTVLHDCNDLKEDCGLHISCNSGTIYLCQKNVKITTETKDKCGG